MSRFSKSLIFLAASIVLLRPHNAAAVISRAQDIQKQTSAALWTSSNAQHVYGLPDTKPDDRGTLSLDGEGLSFTGKSAAFSLQWHSIIALSAGSDQVELWGAKGRLLRMLIPFSGGLAVAAITHHRVDELTVEFRGSKGGYHGAVFLLPPGEALRAVESSSRIRNRPQQFSRFRMRRTAECNLAPLFSECRHNPNCMCRRPTRHLCMSISLIASAACTECKSFIERARKLIKDPARNSTLTWLSQHSGREIKWCARRPVRLGCLSLPRN